MALIATVALNRKFVFKHQFALNHFMLRARDQDPKGMQRVKSFVFINTGIIHPSVVLMLGMAKPSYPILAPNCSLFFCPIKLNHREYGNKSS